MPPAPDPVVHEAVALAPFSSLKVGGAARWFTRAASVADVAAAHAWCAARGVPMVVLGGGTNVVIADAGIDALVVVVAPRGLSIDRDPESLTVTAGAGEPWDAVVAAAVAQQGAGLECLSGIPGFTGGTPIQNVGAYGQDVSATIARVTAFDRSAGAAVQLTNAECGFAYRTSRFKGVDAGRFVVCEVVFRLRQGPPTTTYADVTAALARAGLTKPTLADVRSTVLDIRRGKGMVLDGADPDTRSVGSFFTNPVVAAGEAEVVSARAGRPVPGYPQTGGHVKIPAAWLIERAGFSKGERDGCVGLSTRHTLALVTRDGATAADVVRFAARVARRVEEFCGVRLRPEPVFIGFEADRAGADVDYLLGARN